MVAVVVENITVVVSGGGEGIYRDGSGGFVGNYRGVSGGGGENYRGGSGSKWRTSQKW
jgi:hypothetical protein